MNKPAISLLQTRIARLMQRIESIDTDGNELREQLRTLEHNRTEYHAELAALRLAVLSLEGAPNVQS